MNPQVLSGPPILSDLDFDLMASQLLNVGLVCSFAISDFLGGFSDGTAAQIVLNGLLHRCRHFGQRYLLLVFFSLLACVNCAGKRSGSDDCGCKYNSGLHLFCSSFVFSGFMPCAIGLSTHPKERRWRSISGNLDWYDPEKLYNMLKFIKQWIITARFPIG
jgi:hypothetical protein